MATNSLPKLVNSLCSKLGSSIATADLEAVTQVLNAGMDREILRMFREETALVVVKVRLLNEARKAEWEIKKKELDDED